LIFLVKDYWGVALSSILLAYEELNEFFITPLAISKKNCRGRKSCSWKESVVFVVIYIRKKFDHV
jgi:hypothetical protein